MGGTRGEKKKRCFKLDLAETRGEESCGLEQGGRALAAWSAGRAASCLVPFQESNGGAEGCKKLPEHGFLKGKEKAGARPARIGSS